MAITHVFFDIGGVLGTNGWDHEQRNEAIAKFGLDKDEFEDRHKEMVGSLEAGKSTLDEYLANTVFFRPRSFAPSEFRQFMFSLSRPFPDTIQVARALAGAGRWRLATLNNESLELNIHRLRRFELQDIFGVCFSSCWLGVLKPARRIYELALEMSQAEAEACVFIDDRERNLEPATSLGMRTVLYRGVSELTKDLASLGVVPERSL